MIIEADARRWVQELTEIEREMIILEIKDKAINNNKKYTTFNFESTITNTSNALDNSL